MVRYWGYVCEEHFVTTADGYVLGIHRVPHGKDEQGSEVAKQPVLLAHGMLASSAQWIFGPPENSLGLLLADEGISKQICASSFSMKFVLIESRAYKSMGE